MQLKKQVKNLLYLAALVWLVTDVPLDSHLADIKFLLHLKLTLHYSESLSIETDACA